MRISDWSSDVCSSDLHDPSTANRQGNDRGASYRSAIFYTNEAQKAVAEDTIADVNASGLWPGEVVTEVAPAGDFWEARSEERRVGKECVIRVDLDGRRIIKKNNNTETKQKQTT